MSPVAQFLEKLSQHGQLQSQGKKSIFHFDFPGAVLCFKTTQFSDHIRLHSIFVRSPQQGLGTQLMTLICDIADESGVTIELTALPFGIAGTRRIGISKLISWYRIFGFTVDDDYYDERPVNIGEGLEMIRDPLS